MRAILPIPSLLCLSGASPAQGNPVELGAVDWHRDFDRAVAEAKASDRPLLVLFQEVPG